MTKTLTMEGGMPGKLEGYEDKEVAASYVARPRAPFDVWDHRSYSSWRTEIWTLIKDFADEAVRAAFLEQPPEYVVGDDLSWLDRIVERVHGHEIDSKDVLAQRLGRRYRALRAVHGARTEDLATYYTDGLRPLVPDAFHQQARAIFLSGEFPELSEADLRAAITAVGSDLREGRVYFEANEEMLIDMAGHYMLYGSEYLTAIAAHLGNRRDYKQVLKKRGLPVLFLCDVPLDLISQSTIADFAGDALEAVFQELLDGLDYRRDRWRGAGFCIREPLPADCLVGHYHPVVPRDPLARRG